MNKYFAGVFLGFVATVVGWLVIHKPEPSTAPPPTTTAKLQPSDGGAAPLAEPLTPPELEPMPDGAGGAGTGVLGAGGDESLASGGGSPGLADAPKKISLGIVLVQYLGAEDAKSDARSKTAALALAQEIAALARDDFAAAVKKGDPGSAVDAGSLGRGVLDPEHEALVFTLEKGAVSSPIDTPKGYWIVKRRD